MNKKDKLAVRRRNFLLGTICLLLVFSVFPRVKTVYELSAQRNQLEQQRTALQKTNKALSNRAKQINSPENIEKIAREQLGMVKKGETALVTVDSKSASE